MSSIGELISQFKAAKLAAEELEAEIARSNTLADDLVEQTSAIGFDGKAAQIMEAKARAEQAQNTRWLAEGHLEDAIAVLQAVIDGQKGIGTKIPGGAADRAGAPRGGAKIGNEDQPNQEGRARPEGPEGPATDAPRTDPDQLMGTKLGGDASYVTEWNGSPVKVTYKNPEPEHTPGPSGQDLLQPVDRGRKGANLLTEAVRNADKVQDATKTFGKQFDAAWDAIQDDNPGSSGQTQAIVEVPTSGPVVAPPPEPKPSAGSAMMGAFVIGVVTTKAVQGFRNHKKRAWEAIDSD